METLTLDQLKQFILKHYRKNRTIGSAVYIASDPAPRVVEHCFLFPEVFDDLRRRRPLL